MSTHSQNTIKSNQPLETYRVTLIFIGIAVALELVFTVITVIVIIAGEHTTHVFNASTINLPIAVLALVSFSLQYRRWKRIERRRQVAAEEDPALLAEEQPTPDTTAVALPAAFKMSMNKAQILFMAVLLELAMKALCQLITAQTGLPLYDLRKEQTLEVNKGVASPRFERPPAQ